MTILQSAREHYHDQNEVQLYCFRAARGGLCFDGSFVPYKARRSSSPQLPEHVTVVEAVSKLSKNRQLGIMVNLKFEEAALAYLLNTKGALWLRAQEHQRKEFREKKVEASKVRTC